MSAAKDQDFEMWEKDSKVLSFTHEDEDGNAVNITGFSLVWQLWSSKHDASGTPIIEKSGASISITDAPNGVVEVSLDPADTDGKSGIRYHELRATDASGNEQMVATGTVTIHDNIE